LNFKRQYVYVARVCSNTFKTKHESRKEVSESAKRKSPSKTTKLILTSINQFLHPLPQILIYILSLKYSFTSPGVIHGANNERILHAQKWFLPKLLAFIFYLFVIMPQCTNHGAHLAFHEWRCNSWPLEAEWQRTAPDVDYKMQFGHENPLTAEKRAEWRRKEEEWKEKKQKEKNQRENEKKRQKVENRRKLREEQKVEKNRQQILMDLDPLERKFASMHLDDPESDNPEGENDDLSLDVVDISSEIFEDDENGMFEEEDGSNPVGKYAQRFGRAMLNGGQTAGRAMLNGGQSAVRGVVDASKYIVKETVKVGWSGSLHFEMSEIVYHDPKWQMPNDQCILG
jgi:hypothetical protein